METREGKTRPAGRGSVPPASRRPCLWAGSQSCALEGGDAASWRVLRVTGTPQERGRMPRLRCGVFPLVPTLHLGTGLCAKLCFAIAPVPRVSPPVRGNREAELRRQARSQVQLGNEGKKRLPRRPGRWRERDCRAALAMTVNHPRRCHGRRNTRHREGAKRLWRSRARLGFGSRDVLSGDRGGKTRPASRRPGRWRERDCRASLAMTVKKRVIAKERSD